MSDYFFSIIIPTYNRANLIGRTLQSLLRQTYKEFEIIVVDDGSTDNTKEIVESFKDPRITYCWKKNEERGAARNYGAALAKGEYLNFFDSDDIAYPNHLETANNFLRENKNSIVFHTSFDFRYFDLTPLRSSIIAVGRLNNKIFKNNLLCPNNVFIRKEEFYCLKFSEDRNLSGSEDWLLWIKLACRYDFIGVREVTSSMIQHNGRSMSMATGDSTMKRAIAFEKNIGEDIFFRKFTKKKMAKIIGEIFFLAALYYASEGKKIQSIRYIWRTGKSGISALASKRMLAILKYWIIKW